MLISAVIFLQAEADAAPRPRGRAVHAWLLQQVDALDPALAAYLHGGDSGVRPFTVSDVRWRLDGYSARGLPIVRGKRYVIRITSVMPELSVLLQKGLASRLPERLHLAGASFRALGMTTDASEHAWAGRSSHRALWREAAGNYPPHFALDFTSPTTFRSQGMLVPVPWPRLVFNGLLKKWNLFAEFPLPQELLEPIDRSLALRGYHLRATGIPLGKDAERKAPGFWGRCDYMVVPKDASLLRLVRTLAAFAFFAGVGRETSRGWGQCRLVENS